MESEKRFFTLPYLTLVLTTFAGSPPAPPPLHPVLPVRTPAEAVMLSYLIALQCLDCKLHSAPTTLAQKAVL